MAATDGQIILAASRFGETVPVYIRDFSKTELPAIAKIVKGQHQNLGVPTLSNPSLQSTALFLNAGKKYQILAQPIKIKEGRKPTNVGPKVLIPETYPGFFELLSEDGRSTRCIESVSDLARKPNLRVLVRETFRCNQINRTIHAGEILTTAYENGKYLKCKTLKDEIINLPLETKAKFSPFAKEDSISGVHTVKNLLKKRMPIVVRLVHGTAPKGLKQQFVPELRLLGCVEVDRVFALPLQKDTDLIAVPLNAKIKLQRAKNMEQLENFIEYTRFFDKAQRLLIDARDRLQVVDLKLSDKEKKESKGSSRKLPTLNGSSGGVFESGYVLRKSMSCDSAKYMYQTDLAPLADDYDDIDQIYDYVRGFAPLPKNLNRFDAIPEPTHIVQTTGNQTIHATMKSIDNQSKSQPDSGNYSLIKSSSNNNNSLESIKHSNNNYHHHHHQSTSSLQKIVFDQSTHHYSQIVPGNQIQEDGKPIPPPIETIPGKKLPEKRHRPTLPKLYVKNTCNSHSKSPNGNISPGNGIVINNKDGLEPQSPLFHIRYKSLSSLQLTPDSTTPISIVPNGHEKLINHKLSKSASTQCAREGTLDSSRSGGRTSGESKLPEKKTRRLSRPRSLSNLVWELRPQKEKSKKKLYVHHYDHRQQGTLYL